MNSCDGIACQSHDRGAAKTFLASSIFGRQDDFGRLQPLPGFLEYDARGPEIVRKGLARHDVPVFRLGWVRPTFDVSRF